MKLDIVLARKLAPVLATVPAEDLELVVEMTVLIAHADLRIDSAEAEALRAAMEAVVGSRLSTLSVRTLVGSALKNLDAVGGDAFASRLGVELGRRGAAEDAYRVATIIALSSEDISAEERRYLALLGEGAGISPARMESLEAEAAAALREA